MLRAHLKHYSDTKTNVFKCEGDKLSARVLDEIILEYRIHDKLIIYQSNSIILATKEAEIVDEDDSSLEAHKSNFKNYRKKEFCLAHRLLHRKNPDKCQRRGENFYP